MLPLSLGQLARHPSAGRASPASVFQPANVASASHAEIRALITWLAVFVAASVLIALGHVWARLQVVDLGYRLSATRQVAQRLELENHELAVEVARLEAPARIEEVARTRLGMVWPEKGGQRVLP